MMMSPLPQFLLLLLLLVSLFDLVASFAPGAAAAAAARTHHPAPCGSGAIRMAIREEESSSHSPIDNESTRKRRNNDIEEARKSFEELLRDETIAAQIYSDDKSEEKASILTSAGLHRRSIEMSLLESLRDSDDAIDELVHFWITERDPECAAQIFAMEEQCSDGLIVEERQLLRMMDQHPTWAEPVVRYATLLFLTGRADEAYEMALDALELKPWHFEIPQLLIMISLRNEDLAQALLWARRALPKQKKGDSDTVANRRRHQWVERALEASKKQLCDAEKLREEMTRRLSMLSAQSSSPSLEAWQ